MENLSKPKNNESLEEKVNLAIKVNRLEEEIRRLKKNRVKFKSVLATYKLIKDIYAKLDKIDEWMKAHEGQAEQKTKDIYDLQLKYGQLARRIKRIELKLGLEPMEEEKKV